MNELLAKIPLEGWKSLIGSAICVAAGIGYWCKWLNERDAASIFFVGVGWLGVGLKAGQARTEVKAEQAVQLAAQGTAAATTAMLKQDPEVIVAATDPTATPTAVIVTADSQRVTEALHKGSA